MKSLAWFLCLLLLIPFAVTGCGKKTQDQDNTYTIKGKITALDSAQKKVTVDHEDIPGHMEAMEMPFEVADGKVLQGLKVGDQVVGKLTKANVIVELRKQ
jgi:Cu/Ag efflux protein CusF